MAAAGTKPVLLLVEDDLDICDVIAEVFESRGCTVLVANNGRQALDLLHIALVRVDAILLGMMMPEMDGPQFLEALKHEPASALAPVAVMTASRSHLPGQLPIAVAAWLHKPIEHDLRIVHV